MSYLTVEVDIDHGRIVPTEPAKLPEKGKGLLTVLGSEQSLPEAQKMSPLEAFRALQKQLNLDDAKAAAWMETIRDARR
jgi:hypothetical protein